MADPSTSKPPPMKDLNIDNITENTIIINNQGNDARIKYVMVSIQLAILQSPTLGPSSNPSAVDDISRNDS
jgi:hypothetical protein